MPQEIEVWYLMPALRRKLAEILVKEFLVSQKKISEIFGITPAAVSNYLKSKRGNAVSFSGKELKEIKKTAKIILNDEKNAVKHFYNLSVSFRNQNIVCKIHKKHDKSISNKCNICFE